MDNGPDWEGFKREVKELRKKYSKESWALCYLQTFIFETKVLVIILVWLIGKL